MAKRKRTTRQTGLVGRAVRVGRRALREAESRIPPDLRRQLDRRLKDADKTARQAIKQLQAQVKKASTRADVNSVLKRIDELTKEARRIARGAAARPAATRTRATTTTRTRAATTTRRTATTRTRKPATTRRRPAAAAAAPRRATTTRRAAPRRRGRAATPAAEVELMEVIPVEVDEIDVIEVDEA